MDKMYGLLLELNLRKYRENIYANFLSIDKFISMRKICKMNSVNVFLYQE